MRIDNYADSMYNSLQGEIIMTNQEIAAQQFTAYQREMIDFDFRGIGDEQEIKTRYGFHHGWIVVNGESFDMERAFPDRFFPRFPADQGLSD
jgi:hypothetical protein